MPVFYSLADDDVVEVMLTARDKHFPDVQIVDPKIEVLMATAEEGKDPVKHHGVPALMKIAVVKAEERSTGGPDIRIKVDAGRYADLNPVQREASFAHELEHIVFVRDKNNRVRRDDYDRPMVRMKPDDWNINGFLRIHTIYGDNSLERMTFNSVATALGQRTFEFMAEKASVRLPERYPDDDPGLVDDEEDDRRTA